MLAASRTANKGLAPSVQAAARLLAGHALLSLLVLVGGCASTTPQGLLERGLAAEREHLEDDEFDRRDDAAELYEKACVAGLEHACFFFERLMFVRRSSVAEFKRRESRYRSACEGGDGRACFQWGLAFDDEGGVGVEATRAMGLYDRSCRLGYAYACQRGAGLHYVMRSHPISVVESRRLSRVSCEAGYGRACVVEANLTKGGRGGPRDVPRSRELLRRGCKRGQLDACVRLAKWHMHRVRTGVAPRAALKAREELDALSKPLSMACRHGHGPGCLAAVELAMEPLPVPRRDQARKLLLAGCIDGGLSAACRQLDVAIRTNELPAPPDPIAAKIEAAEITGSQRGAMRRERARSIKRLAKRCSAGESRACHRSARFGRHRGETGRQRRARLERLRARVSELARSETRFWLAYFRGRCLDDHAIAACGRLVTGFEAEHGMTADLREAARDTYRRLEKAQYAARKQRYGSACDADEAFGCYVYARLLRHPIPGTPADEAGAKHAEAKARRLEAQLRRTWRAQP